jgi:hypothetical protein
MRITTADGKDNTQANEFKDFQRKLVTGGDTEALWQWLKNNINFVP